MSDRPRSVTEAERPWSGNWDEWRPADLPDLSDVEMWPEAPWHEPVDHLKVDYRLTDELARIPDLFAPHQGYQSKVRVNQGKVYRGVASGAPYQRTEDYSDFSVWMYQDGTRTKTLRLPETIRRFGDPNPEGTDSQSFFIDAERGHYTEVSSFGPSWAFRHSDVYVGKFLWWTLWRIVATSRWQAGRLTTYDLSKPWDQKDGYHPAGIIAARTPLVAQLPKPEHFRAGRIPFALQFVAAGYSPEAPVGYARATDGQVRGHPLRAGQKLAITAERVAELKAEYPGRRDIHTLLDCLHEFGCDVSDQTGISVGHSLRLSMTTEYDVNDLELDITDFVAIIT